MSRRGRKAGAGAARPRPDTRMGAGAEPKTGKHGLGSLIADIGGSAAELAEMAELISSLAAGEKPHGNE